MKKQIWKYALSDFSTNLQIPKGAEILTVQIQNHVPCMWILVDPEEELEERQFEAFGTGFTITYSNRITYKYIATYQLAEGSLVFHLFEKLNK